MNDVRSDSAELSGQEIEALKMTQDVIKRMADNSAKTKTIFIGLTVAIVTLSKVEPTQQTLMAWVVYAVLTFVLWFTDAKYLRLERLFRKHHQAIVNGSISSLDRWRMDVSRYKVEALLSIMLTNFTMMMYFVAELIAIVAIVIVLYHLPA